MNVSELNGRIFRNTSFAERLGNGDWQITVTIYEKVIRKDGTEQEEKVESMCQDSDFDVAQQTALMSCMIEINQLVYDKGLTSLVEGINRVRGEAGHDDSDFHETEPTQ